MSARDAKKSPAQRESAGRALPRHARAERNVWMAQTGAVESGAQAALRPGVHLAQIVASRSLKDDAESAEVITLRLESGALIETVIRYKSVHCETQMIGQRALAELCAVCGRREPLTDMAALHGIPFKIKLTRTAGGGLQIANVKCAPPLLPWNRAGEWPSVVGARA